jgi:cytochrome b subunit of formate dehydrogenase
VNSKRWSKPEFRMKKWLRNYILFIIMLLLGAIQVISGFLLWLVIPGGHRGLGITRSGLFADTDVLWSRYTWIEIHDWTAVALLVIVIIHIILHWKWITFMTKKMIGMNTKMEENDGKEKDYRAS